MHEQFGRYVLLERIAVGGMAEIFRAKAPGLGGFEKILAIKRLHPRYSQDTEFIDMLIDEARITAELSHSNIGQIFDLAKVDDHYFIAMEYIDGRDVYRIMKRCRAQERQFPFEAAAFIAMEAATGLDFAHRKKNQRGTPLNIVHRDVSPQNVLVSFDGEVKVVDFGIAKNALRAHETEAGIIKGKFYYMSPEQARGEVLDHRTDIFSLGIVLYELVTGELLYKDDDEITLLSQVRRAEVEPPSMVRPDIPERLEQIIMRALSKERGDRYPSAQHLQRDLARFLRTYNPSFSRGSIVRLMAELYHGEVGASQDDASEDLLRREGFVHDKSSVISVSSYQELNDETMQQDVIESIDSDIVELGSSNIEISAEFAEMGSDLLEELEDSQSMDALRSSTGDENEDFFDSDPTRAFQRGAPAPQSAPRRPRTAEPQAKSQSRRDRRERPARREEPVETRSGQSQGRGGADADFSEEPTSMLTGNLPPAAASAGRRPESVVSESPLHAKPPGDSWSGLLSHEWLYVLLALLFFVFSGYTIASLLLGSDEPEQRPVLRVGGDSKPTKIADPTRPSAPEGAMATLDIRTTPAGAKIQINGVWEFETTPNRVRVSAGKPIQIKIAQKRFRPHEETLTLGANEQRQLVLDLEPLMGQLEVDSVPSDAVVFIQGRERGRTPVTLSRIPLDKNLRVRVMKDGFKTFDELVDWADAEDGQRLRVKARLEPVRGSDLSERTRKRARRSRSRSGARRSRSGAPRRAARPARPAGRGKLNVVSKPWGQIFVDGRLAHEEGPLIGYELSAGRHRVYVCFQGKRDRCTSPQTVKIRPGETTRLKIQ